MVVLPSGTVTFLFTDMEGSTRRWETQTEAMRAEVVQHDDLVRAAVGRCKGGVFSVGGDGFGAAFGRAGEALACAVEIQQALREAGLPGVRMGVHTGEADERDGNYFGTAVNRAARLMAIGHGGQILVSQATAHLASGLELRELGEHRLRDLSTPERVFQLCAPTLPSTFPALRSLDNFPTNLPAQANAFIGRAEEMAEAEKLLASCRALTLTGVGGVGKTRLALQVAAEVLPEYRDGVFLVELGGVGDPSAVGESIASTLLVQQQSGQTVTESLLAFLGHKRLLLVLDNCEHLLEPVAELVARMLAVAPDVKVLTTSREALRIDGEQVITVPSLGLPDESAELDLLATADAVRLFVDRAHATRAAFALDAENASAVIQLCRRLDGIPLAIELAAARVRSMAPSEIAERLDQRFRLLTGGTRTAASRHQTLRRAIDWSYDTLELVDQTLLGRLSVCLGGFDLAAAEAIGAGGPVDALDVDDALGRLVDKSMVLASDFGDMTRYKMLETIREYAFERLDATGETPHVRTRHASHYTGVAEQAGAGLKGPHERTWLTRIEDEFDNLRAGVMWSLASGDHHLACTCVLALGLQGIRIEPVVSAWAESITACDAAQDDPAYPIALALTGHAKMGEGHTDEAIRLLEHAFAQLDQRHSPAHVACRVSSCLASVMPTLGRNPREQADRWRRAAEAAGDTYEQACSLNMVAVSMNMDGDPAAHQTAEESLRLARQSGSPSAIAFCLFVCAMVDAPTDPARALDLLDQSLESADTAGNTFAAITAAGIRNAVLFQSEQYEAAAHAYLDAAQRAVEYGRRDQQMPILGGLGVCLAALGALEPAAVIDGWFRSSLVRTTDVMMATGPLYEGPMKLINQLPELLGEERYSQLNAFGATMSALQLLDYAREQVAALTARSST
jgi:predicted ATPase/class 3 adenylate cyclase